MISGKELVLRALRFEKTDRIPWVPFTGVHCAKLIDMEAEPYLKDSGAIVRGVTAAAERYMADGVCSVFDLQMEAEIFGCELRWAKNNPPAVATHVLDSQTLGDLPVLTRESGRLPVAFEATTRLAETIGDRLAIFGLVCGPFTLAMHLAGTEFIMYVIKQPDKAKEILQFCCDTVTKISEWYLEARADVIAVVDPMTSQISPKHFRQFVAPYVIPTIEAIKKKNGLVTLFCCGDATKNIEPMMECKPSGIAFDEQVSVAMARELADKHEVAIEGNLHLTTTLLFGSPTECVADAKNCMTQGGNRGYILSPGCDLPYDTPFYNLEAVGRYAVLGEEPSDTAGFLSLEAALAKCDADAEGFEDVETVPGKVFVEIVTLDSEGCAPCQYMVEGIKRIAPHYGEKLAYRETLIKSLAGIKRTQSLGVTTLPTMLMNNEVVFDNITPTDEELKKEIDKRL